MESRRRQILHQVAAGSLSPEQAAAQLDEAGGQPTSGPGQIARVRVVRQLGPTQVIGDPGVIEAVAEGPHTARREGDTLVIEGEPQGVGFSFFPGQRLGFPFGLGSEPQAVRVRMNPRLALDIDVQAGTLRVAGVKGPIHANVQAGSTSIDGFQGPLTISLQAGSVRASGCIVEGASRIRCEAGSVFLHLDRGSSVRIRARSTMGRVTLPGGGGRTRPVSDVEAVIGDGRAGLEIDNTMGSVRVSADE